MRSQSLLLVKGLKSISVPFPSLVMKNIDQGVSLYSAHLKKEVH